MESDVNMFCVDVKFGMVGDGDGCLVVAENGQDSRLWNSKLLAKSSMPENLLGNVGGCDVLCFGH